MGAGQFAARTDLVEVYVAVADASGRPLDGLARESFHVRDNGVERPIAAFAAGSLPLSMAVLVDHSFSMRGTRLAASRAGALGLLDALRANDRVDVLAIGSDVEIIATPEQSREAAREAVRGLAPWGTSPIVDAIRATTRPRVATRWMPCAEVMRWCTLSPSGHRSPRCSRSSPAHRAGA
jgi:Mg-chelatase subunit ChlD